MITPVTELAATRGRILGVDFGDRRTGLAISDASRFLAGGIGTVSPGGIAATVKAVAGIAAEQGAAPKARAPSDAANLRLCWLTRRASRLP